MSTHPPDRCIDRSQVSKHPYSPSLASTASSSASSIFSIAASVSSVASSISSQNSIQSEGVKYLGDIERHAWSQEQRNKEAPLQSHPPRALRVPPPPLADHRPHQRRAPRCAEPHRATCTTEACPMPSVPTLVRQAERKTNFVDNLVDSAAQIVETIWPTYMNGKVESSAGKGVLPLRTFIQETLRRSRTSYSTLQVALYYLIIVRPHIPKGDFSDMTQENAQQMRALQCGRRMFLAALILASKYLQDRNYSARAWSRISGLQTTEININEMAFLDAVNWRLHISESIFQKWTDLVVKYTSGSGGPGSPSDEARKAEWSKLIVKLTPELTIEEVSGDRSSTKQEPEVVVQKIVETATPCLLRADSGCGSECTTPIPDHAPMTCTVAKSTTFASIPKVTVSSLLSSPKNQPLPLPTLEPQPQHTALKSLPQSTRLAALSNISPLKTPAVRLGSGNAMSSAAAAAQLSQLQRCTTEDMAFLSRKCTGRSSGEKALSASSAARCTMLTRRTSLSCSMTSSPETLNDSDSSTTSSPFAFSRSSSISSASSFDSVGSFDTTKHCEKSIRVISPATAPAKRSSSTSETGLNTPTPSPPRYLPLRPKASREFCTEGSLETRRSPLTHCRKRRICELALPIPEIDNGVSPNLSSGMTPQMKLQLQMRTPPLKNGLGPKRLRCAAMEPSVLALPKSRGSQEEVS